METKTNTSPLEVVNAYEIYMKDLPPTKWYVGDILHEGACLLSGDPKVGKSFLALQIAVAIAGTTDRVCGALPVGVHGRVLYLALDDGSEKRIHDRLHQLTDDAEAIKNIDFVYQRTLPSLSNGLDALLDELLGKSRYVLVVLDTLGAVLDPNQGKSNVYRSDYMEAILLQKLAQKYGICLLILHHTNKGDSKSPIARASGSHGLTGAVDSVLLLASEQGRPYSELIARPRDGESSELCLERLDTGGWGVTDRGAAEHFASMRTQMLTEESIDVQSALAEGPKFRDEIAEGLGITPEAARKRLERMERRGLVRKLPEGRYERADAGAIVPAVRPVLLSEVAAVDHPTRIM